MPRRLVFCGWSLPFDLLLPVARLLTQFPPWAFGVGRKQAKGDKATRQKQVRTPRSMSQTDIEGEPQGFCGEKCNVLHLAISLRRPLNLHYGARQNGVSPACSIPLLQEV
jgi:hypothetical protein